jgi:hypothetical protein
VEIQEHHRNTRRCEQAQKGQGIGYVPLHGTMRSAWDAKGEGCLANVDAAKKS